MSRSANEFPENNTDQHFQEPGEPLLPTSNHSEEDLDQTPLPAESDPETQQPESSPLNSADLPPEAQGEANGGPLGCCLGVMVGIVLSLSIAIISRVYPELFVTIFGEHISIITRVIMIIVLIAAAILFGIAGWRLGLRFYREYEPSPRYQKKMAELEARQKAFDRRQARRRKRSTNLS